MFRFASLALVFAAIAFAEDVAPTSPCLSGPVTQGNITLSCTLIDNTILISADLSCSCYIFQVRASSIDPDVLAMRFTLVTSTQMAGSQPIVQARSVLGQKRGSVFYYTFQLSAGYDANLQAIPISITSIGAQELKGASAQTF